MKNQNVVSSAELVEYLLDESNGETRQKVDQAKKTDRSLQSLLDLLESCKQRGGLTRDLLDSEYVPLKIVEKRELLMRLYSGDLGPEDGRLLLNELNNSTSRLLDDLMMDMAPGPKASVPITERIPILAGLFRKPRVLSKKEALDTVMAQPGQEATPEPVAKDRLEGESPPKTVISKPGFRTAPWPKLAGFSWAYLIVLVMMIAGGSYLVVKNLGEDDILEQYVYDIKLPYEYTSSSFRSAPTGFEDDPLFRRFDTQFKLAMGDYVTFNYAAAIRILAGLEPTVVELQQRSNSEELLSGIRDYYFYLGVSHLAIGRSEKSAQELKVQHFNDAIRALAAANSLAISNNLEGGDRELFFLGLAYGLGGRSDAAVEQLEKIEPQSKFFSASADLIGRWSND